jgi:hypothetical protein
MIKQYVIRHAYAGNDAIDIYEDGIKVNYRVMAYWETECFCNILKSEGYTQAYDLDELKKELDDAKEKYETAKQTYEEALPFALIKK